VSGCPGVQPGMHLCVPSPRDVTVAPPVSGKDLEKSNTVWPDSRVPAAVPVVRDHALAFLGKCDLVDEVRRQAVAYLPDGSARGGRERCSTQPFPPCVAGLGPRTKSAVTLFVAVG